MIHFILITQAILETLITILIYLVIVLIGIFITDKIHTYYSRWKTERRYKRLNKEYEKREQQRRKRREEQELYRKEQERYPLFYWRESCCKDSDQRETCKVKEKK